jgi:hypothetical protein
MRSASIPTSVRDSRWTSRATFAWINDLAVRSHVTGKFSSYRGRRREASRVHNANLMRNGADFSVHINMGQRHHAREGLRRCHDRLPADR